MRSVVSRYAVAVAVAAVAAATATSSLVVRPELSAVDLAVLVALTAALVAAAALPIEPTGDGDHVVTLEEAVLLAMLVVVPVGVLPWLVLLGVTLEQLRRRAPWVKLAFNAGAAGLGAVGAVAVVLRLRDLLEPSELVAELGIASFGVLVATGVQLVLFAQLRHLLDDAPIRQHLGVTGFLDVALVLNVLLGVVLSAAILSQPWTAVAGLGLVLTLGGLLRDRPSGRSDDVGPADHASASRHVGSSGHVGP